MMPQSITKSAAKESAFILLSSFSGKLGIRNFSLRALNINMSKKNKSEDAIFDLFDTPPKDVQNSTAGVGELAGLFSGFENRITRSCKARIPQFFNSRPWRPVFVGIVMLGLRVLNSACPACFRLIAINVAPAS